MAYTTINKGSSYFNTVLYTGTGASNAITGVGFKPDWVWIKRRDSSASHALFDINRGVNKQLRTNTSGIEETVSWFPSFDTDGFTVSTTESDGNANGGTYASWNWLGSNTTTSNTSGSISSTVSVNQTAGFSIVSYTGNGNDYPTGATVGHGLGVAPSMIITKSRSEATTNWCVYHKGLPGADYVALLNSTAAPSSGGDSYNRTNPTSTVFSVGQASGGSRTNGNGATYISYCFSQIKGYSSFGKYIGNGNADGRFIYTGFKPAWVMIKTTSAGEAWNMGDNKRNITYPSGANVNNAELYANSSSAETDRSTRGGGITQFDMLSNGFKCRGANPDINYSGYNYIYMAFAENPFVTSGGIPVTAR